jgi:hypothetical protein
MHRLEHRGRPLLALEAVFAAGDREAGTESLDVPLPGPGQRLVEVVEVEDEAAVGGGEGAEVREVGSPQACTRSPETGVVTRSAAITAAAPRKKAKGEADIRP